MNKNDAWITTYTGKQFYPFNPNPDDVDIRDIAHHLSNICRYAGACNVHYSVAEHCVRLSSLVVNSSKAYALMHDAAEAYFADIPSLIKRAWPEVMAMEDNLLSVILAKFDVRLEHIKWSEDMLTATEVRDLKIDPTGWYFPVNPTRERIEPWSPFTAKVAFLTEFDKVIGWQAEEE